MRKVLSPLSSRTGSSSCLCTNINILVGHIKFNSYSVMFQLKLFNPDPTRRGKGGGGVEGVGNLYGYICNLSLF